GFCADSRLGLPWTLNKGRSLYQKNLALSLFRKFPVFKRGLPSFNAHVSDPMSNSTYRIAVGADHGAFEMKNALVAHLREGGHEVEDFGTDSPASVDYPDFGNAVARNVADGTYDFGILA